MSKSKTEDDIISAKFVVDGVDFEAEFEEVCENCDGTGIVQHPRWKEWQNKLEDFKEEWLAKHPDQTEVDWKQSDKHSELWDNRPGYEDGAKTTLGSVPEEVSCPECDGAGMKLTDAGRAVVKLVNRHADFASKYHDHRIEEPTYG